MGVINDAILFKHFILLANNLKEVIVFDLSNNFKVDDVTMKC